LKEKDKHCSWYPPLYH